MGRFPFVRRILQEMLERGRCRLDVRIQIAMMKDSLEITDEDREQILAACRSCDESRIVVTHGTDTMELTAQFLDAKLADKTIVLTGAMIPYTFGSSDGLFNLGSALSFAQTLPPGVYIAMNGCLFRPNEVYKDKKLGVFRAKSNEPTDL